jgi:GntR family transcriptional repressor for pyruvate dehydrogenase complex
MKFNAIKINSAPEVLVQQIIEQIDAGALKPGDCLPSQRELARIFEVGLGTVREALKILNVMGCVTILRGKGSYVAYDVSKVRNKDAKSVEEVLEAVSLADLMKARQIVESGAARMAAEKADTESIHKLRQITARMLSGNLSRKAYYQYDAQYHIAVAEAAENQAILEIVKLLVDKTHQHTGFMDSALGISLPEAKKRCGASAGIVVDYIQAGDSEKAARAMLAHLDIVNDHLTAEFAVSHDRTVLFDAEGTERDNREDVTTGTAAGLPAISPRQK